MKEWIALLLCAAISAGCLTGCVIEGKSEYTPTGNGLYSEDNTVPVETTKPEDEEEKPDIVMAYYPELTMNPFTCTDYTNRAVFTLLYQSLFVTDQNYNVAPVLCKSFTVSEDMKNYTFYLDENARFSNGDRVTGEDVTASLLAAMASGYYVGRFSHVKSIANTRDGGVLIQLDTPYENLPILLDIPVVKKSQVDHETPIGSGPYVLRDNEIAPALYKNPQWWCKAKLPVDQDIIRLTPITGSDGTVQIRDQFEFFDVNLVLADPGSAFYAEYRCDYELWDCASGVFVFLGCRTDEGVFANKDVRAALTYAIDRATIVSEYYRGFAEPAVLPTPKNSPYYDNLLAAQYGFENIRLSQAIINAGLKDSKVVLLANSDDTRRIQVARAIARMLEACGLKVEVKEETGDPYYRALQYKEYDLYLGQTRLSPNMDLTEFFDETGKISFGPMNDAAIYAQCLLALENSGNYSDLQRAILNDGRLVPVVFRNYAVYANRGVVEDLAPARDNLFYYDLGKTVSDVRKDYVVPETEFSLTEAPEETTAPEQTTVPEETTAPAET